MILSKMNGRVRCDMGGCTNPAEYAVGREGLPPGSRLFLCEECAKKIAALVVKAEKAKKEREK